MRIELHADDLGATLSVNRNIISAWQSGGIDGVSVLANGDALHEAAIEINADKDRRLRLAVHLNLSEGYPLIEGSQVPMLVDESGRLRHGFLALWRLWLQSTASSRRRLLQQVELEWRAQIKAVRDAFLPRSVAGLDGHIHIHMLPFLFPLAVRVACEFDIPQIRISREVLHFSLKESCRIGYASNILKHTLLAALSIPARRLATQQRLATPGAVAGLLYSGRMSRRVVVAAANAARRRDLSWLEVICHPGRAAPQEANRWAGQPKLARFYLSPHRDLERDALIYIGAERLRNYDAQHPKQNGVPTS